MGNTTVIIPSLPGNATASKRGLMSAADKEKLDGLDGAGTVVTAAPVSGDGSEGDPVTVAGLSGTNTGDVTLGEVGAAPAAEGATLAGQVLTLQPADATRPGLMSILAQSIAGAKTWLALAVFSLGIRLGSAQSVGWSSAADGSAAADTTLTRSAIGVKSNYGFEAGVSSGSSAFKMLDGARLNFSTADASAYLYRSGTNTISAAQNFRVVGDFELPTNSAAYLNGTTKSAYVFFNGTNVVLGSPGLVTTAKKITATEGIGVGNSAAATTPGTVTKKMEVFDATGNSLGFVAIYDAIT